MIENFTPQNDSHSNKENQLQSGAKYKRERNIVTDKDENEKQYKSNKDLGTKKKKSKLQFMSRDNSF